MYKKFILSLALIIAVAPTCYAATAIYRSVGPDAISALASGTSPSNALSISGSTATFTSELPVNIGVGDAIQYDSDDNGTIDAICFIHGRTDSRHYTVKDATGAAPTATSASDNDWAIYRAYTSLYDAERGVENTGVSDTVENFDTWSGGKDLVAANQIWNIACYANGMTADTTILTISEWNTGGNNYIRIYTPISTTEVGVSQRHQGKWDDKKYHMMFTTTVSGISLNEEYVRFEGMQFKQTPTGASSNAIIYIGINTVNSDLRFSNNIFWADLSAVTNGYYFKAFDQGSSIRNARFWNNIFYNFKSPSNLGRAICLCAASPGISYIYNNTVYNCGEGFYRSGTGTAIAINNITQNCVDGYYGTFTSSDYNISDLSGDAPGGHSKNLTTVSFVDLANKDFHLMPNDTAARDAGLNLSEDANLAFLDDIDGQIRTGTWDIGADEMQQSVIRNAIIRNATVR